MGVYLKSDLKTQLIILELDKAKIKSMLDLMN